MNRKKWQGLTCILLASLMMGSTFASSTRNAAPKPVETPKQIEAPKATPVPQPAVPKSVETPKPVEMPKAPAPKTIIPESVKTPKVTVPKTAIPKASQMPKPSEAPKKQEVVPPKSQPSEAPKCVTPKAVKTPAKEETAPKKATEIKKEAKPAPQIQKQDSKCPEKTQKPFTLDHFKMIVCTLKQLGMEDDEIVTYIKDGKKLEDILTAEKISARKFKKCILKQYCKAIDDGVRQGQITKEQGKQLKTAIKDTVKNWLPKK